MTVDSPRNGLVSVVLSFRNEESVIPELIRRLEASLTPLGTGFELIFVNDDSSDGSLDLLLERAARDPRIKIITMSRRFGVTECVLAGIERARGEAIVYMDADLQDPPEVIPRLVEKWREGADVVYTVRARRHGENPCKKAITRVAYWMIRSISEIPIPMEAGDFRLISRRVQEHLLRLKEGDPYLRGLVPWVGFRQVAVSYERAPRGGGETHYPLFMSVGPVNQFFRGMTSFSMIPLYAVFLIGLFSTAASIAGFAAILLAPLLGFHIPASARLPLLLVLLWGTLMTALGVVAIYLGRIYKDVRGRPRYIVKDAIGFDS